MVLPSSDLGFRGIVYVGVSFKCFSIEPLGRCFGWFHASGLRVWLLLWPTSITDVLADSSPGTPEGLGFMV